MATQSVERFDTVIVGGGQAGLATGYHLAKRGQVVRDPGCERANRRPLAEALGLPAALLAGELRRASGDAVPGAALAPSQRRTRWPTSSSRTPRASSCPSARARPWTSCRRNGERYVVTAGTKTFEADNVVVATGVMQKPVFRASPRSSTRASRNSTRATTATPRSFRRGLSWWSARATRAPTSPTRQLPSTRRSCREQTQARSLRRSRPGAGAPVQRVLFFVGSHVLTMDTPLGRKMRPHVRHGGAPLLRYRKKDLRAAGVERVFARTVGVQDGLPVLDDGRVLDVRNVIWCTGFRHGLHVDQDPPRAGRGRLPRPVPRRRRLRPRPLLRGDAVPALLRVDAHRRSEQRRRARREAPRVATDEPSHTCAAGSCSLSPRAKTECIVTDDQSTSSILVWNGRVSRTWRPEPSDPAY